MKRAIQVGILLGWLVPALCSAGTAGDKPVSLEQAYKIRAEADRLYVGGKFDDARTFYLRVYNRFREDADLNERLGWCFYKGHKPDLGRAIFYWSVSLQFQKNETLEVEIARAYLQMNRWDEASRLMLRLAKDHPEHSEHWRELARMAEQAGRREDALDWYRAYLDRRPGDTETRLELARLLFQAKQYMEALTEYNIVLQSDPRNEAARAGVERVRAATEQPRRRGSR